MSSSQTTEGNWTASSQIIPLGPHRCDASVVAVRDQPIFAVLLGIGLHGTVFHFHIGYLKHNKPNVWILLITKNMHDCKDVHKFDPERHADYQLSSTPSCTIHRQTPTNNPHTSTLFGYDLIAILRPIDNSLMLSWERNKCDVNCEMYKPETSNLVTLGTMCSKTTFNCSLFVVNWVFVTSNSRLVRFSSSWTLRNSLLVTIGAAVSQKGACKSAQRTHTHIACVPFFFEIIDKAWQ